MLLSCYFYGIARGHAATALKPMLPMLPYKKYFLAFTPSRKGKVFLKLKSFLES